MKPDWIPRVVWVGEVTVQCHTCESTAEFNPTTRTYECDCRFGATAEALAYGCPGYEWET